MTHGKPWGWQRVALSRNPLAKASAVWPWFPRPWGTPHNHLEAVFEPRSLSLTGSTPLPGVCLSRSGNGAWELAFLTSSQVRLTFLGQNARLAVTTEHPLPAPPDPLLPTATLCPPQTPEMESLGRRLRHLHFFFLTNSPNDSKYPGLDYLSLKCAQGSPWRSGPACRRGVSWPQASSKGQEAEAPANASSNNLSGNWDIDC